MGVLDICEDCRFIIDRIKEEKDLLRVGSPIFIYLIYFDNISKYAGQSFYLEKRKIQHFEEDSPLGEAIRNFGCHYEIVTTVFTPDWANKCETFLIEKLNLVNNGFNRIKKGNGTLNFNIKYCPLHKEWDKMCQQWKREGGVSYKDKMKCEYEYISQKFVACEDVLRFLREDKYKKWGGTAIGKIRILESEKNYSELTQRF